MSDIWVMPGRYLGWGRLQLVITVMNTCHFYNNNKNIYLFRVDLLAGKFILHNLSIKSSLVVKEVHFGEGEHYSGADDTS